MSERDEAIALANRVLDKPRIDPDGDICLLARQFLRAIETAEQLGWELIKARDFIDDSAFNVPNNGRYRAVTSEIDAAIAALPPLSPVAHNQQVSELAHSEHETLAPVQQDKLAADTGAKIAARYADGPLAALADAIDDALVNAASGRGSAKVASEIAAELRRRQPFLRHDVNDLSRALVKVMDSRNLWKNRAENAEAKLAESVAASRLRA